MSTGTVAGGLGWSVTGNVVLRLGNVAMSIVIARLIAPDDFGVFAVALTIWSVLGTLAEFGLGSDLVRAEDPERRAPTVATLGLVTSLLLAGSMAAGADVLAGAFASPESAGVVRLMAISIAVFGLTIVPAAHLQRAYRQGTLFAVNAVGLASSALTMTALAVQGAGPAALAWGQIANQVAIVVGLHLATRSRPRLGWDAATARESVRFCLPLAVANLVSWLLLSVDNLVVSRTAGPASLGLYLLAFNVSSWPMSAVGQALRVVALPAFARAGEEGRGRALVRCAGPTAAVAVLLGVGLSTLAAPLVEVLYGVRWLPSADALAGLAVFGALRVGLDLVATFLIAAGATSSVLVVQVVWLAAMVPAMWLGVRGFGLAGAGWAHVAVAVVVVVPLYGLALRRVGVDPRRLLGECLVPLVAAVPAVGACILIARWDAPALLVLSTGGLAALLLYALPLRRWWLGGLRRLREPVATEHRRTEPDPTRPRVLPRRRGATTDEHLTDRRSLA